MRKKAPQFKIEWSENEEISQICHTAYRGKRMKIGDFFSPVCKLRSCFQIKKGKLQVVIKFTL